jgi:hypothetical protein
MNDYRIIAAGIIIGFILHAFIITTFEKPTAGQLCVENMKKTKAYKKQKKHFDKGTYIQMMCGQANN